MWSRFLAKHKHEKILYGAQFKFRSPPSRVADARGAIWAPIWGPRRKRLKEEKSVETGVMTRPCSWLSIPLIKWYCDTNAELVEFAILPLVIRSPCTCKSLKITGFLSQFRTNLLLKAGVFKQKYGLTMRLRWEGRDLCPVWRGDEGGLNGHFVDGERRRGN